MADVISILAILFIVYIVRILLSKSSDTKNNRNKGTATKNSVTKSSSKKVIKEPKKVLKPYFKDIVYIDTTPSSTLKDASYIDSNFVWGTSVRVDFNQGGIVRDANGKVLGQLSNRHQKVDRVSKTLEKYPNHYCYVLSSPGYDKIRQTKSEEFRIGVFIGWTDNANFQVYKLNDNRQYNLKSSPCNEYVEIELSNKKSVLETQASLLIKSGYLENALEIFLKLWENKGQWNHRLLSICRKLQKYKLEKTLIENYLDVNGQNKEYEKRLKVLSSLIDN